MHFLMKIILALYVILYSMDQASSLKCYECHSVAERGDQECAENPKQKKFEKTCPEYMPDGTEDSPNAGAAAHSAENTDILSIVKHAKSTQTEISTRAIKFKANECWKLRVTNLINQEQALGRLCGSKEYTDELFKMVAEELLISLESIHRCDTDLCNSSDVLSVGFFNLISSLLFAYSINV